MKIHSFILLLFFFSVSSIVVAQQIGNGLATSVLDFNVPLLSGIYQTGNQQVNFPNETNVWNHLFVIRHSNAGINNNQLQLASTYSENDKLYFRKIASSTLQNRNSTWYEIATRGSNTFTGDQLIKGKINLEPGNHILFGNPTGNRVRLQLWTNGQTYLDFYPFMHIRGGSSDGNLSYVMSFASSGNVGIGTTNPTNKLDVNGTIRAKEVRIENTNWPDYVFSKNYQLPSLTEVSRHIEENKHLPGIPSAEEVAKEGINISEMNSKLLQKIEEMTLYIIQQEKRIEILEKKIEKQN